MFDDVDSCWFYKIIKCAWILCGSSVWIIEPGCILSHCTSCSHWISKGSTTSALALLPQWNTRTSATSSKKLWLGSLLDIWQPWDLLDAPFWLLKAFYALPLPCPLPRKNMKKIKAYKSREKTSNRPELLNNNGALQLTSYVEIHLCYLSLPVLSCWLHLEWPVVLLLRVELHGGGVIHQNLMSWLTTQHKLQRSPLDMEPTPGGLGSENGKASDMHPVIIHCNEKAKSTWNGNGICSGLFRLGSCHSPTQ